MTPEQTRALQALIESTLSHNEIHDALRSTLKERHSAAWVYLSDVYDDHVVYSVEVKTTGEETPGAPLFYDTPYGVDSSGKITLGESVEVKRTITYVPVSSSSSEAASESLKSDIVDLIEKAVADDNTMDIKIIAPGWGSSGYYSEEVLKRDGPAAWPVGSHMHLDHPTKAEKDERPEGSVKDLAAAIATEPVYQEKGPSGPGLYAKAAVIPEYKPLIDALQPHIGVSIRAKGQFTEGEADGKRGPIVTAIREGGEHLLNNVDFVTKAGAGGKVLALMESLRPENYDDESTSTPDPDPQSSNDRQESAGTPKEGLNMDEVERLTKELAEATTRIGVLEAESTELKSDRAKLRESQALNDARGVIAEDLKKIELHPLAKTRLTENILLEVKLTDEGALDTQALSESITKQSAKEAEYVAGLTESGKPHDLGSSGKPTDSAKLEESYYNRYVGEGMDPEKAKKSAAIAAGR